MTDEALPAGFSLNSPEQIAKLRAAALELGANLPDTVDAVALVFAMADGTVTAALVGDASNIRAYTKLMAAGPEVLRLTVERCLAGKGTTRIVARGGKRSK